MAISTDELTLEQYAALDEPDPGYVSDLVRGQLVREPRPARRHGRLQARIAGVLSVWAETHGTGEVTAESGYVLKKEPATVRGPDVAVSLNPVDADVGGWTSGAPDVAVEVLSPSDSSTSMQEKVLDYLEAGSSLVWVVDPRARTVTVYRPDGSAQLLRGAETLTGEDVLPGFSGGLPELFRD